MADRRVNPDGTGGIQAPELPEMTPEAYQAIESYLEAELEAGNLDFSSDVTVQLTGYNFSGPSGFAEGDTGVTSRSSGEEIREYSLQVDGDARMQLQEAQNQVAEQYKEFRRGLTPNGQKVLEDWIEQGKIEAPHVNLRVDFGQATQNDTYNPGSGMDVGFDKRGEIVISADTAAEKADFEGGVQKDGVGSITIRQNTFGSP